MISRLFIDDKGLLREYTKHKEMVVLRSNPNCRWCPREGCGAGNIGEGGEREGEVVVCCQCGYEVSFSPFFHLLIWERKHLIFHFPPLSFVLIVERTPTQTKPVKNFEKMQLKQEKSIKKQKNGRRKRKLSLAHNVRVQLRRMWGAII